MNIAIIGKGNVGSALEAGLSREGHEARAVGRDPGGVREAGETAELVILAVPFDEIDNAVHELGSSVAGKVVVDATNALTPEYDLAVGFTPGNLCASLESSHNVRNRSKAATRSLVASLGGKLPLAATLSTM